MTKPFQQDIAANRWSIIFVSITVLALFSIAFFQTAWVAEDAFITFRTIDNALNGLGLTWNPGERVQTYTHPLWFALLLSSVAIFKDPYYVSLALSYALSFYTLCVLILGTGGWRLQSALAVIALLWSRAFIDYSSSGLENPLTHALLVTYLFAWLKMSDTRKKCYVLTAIAAAMFLTRPDAIVLIIPSLAIYFWDKRQNIRECAVPFILGAVPAIVWVAFSIFYYGAPVPNTALAKIQTGQNLYQNAVQAWNYYGWAVWNDLPTAIILNAGIIAGLIGRRRNLWPLSVGLLLWACYLIYVGADYMGGRFFSAPTLLASAIIAIRVGDIPGKRIVRIMAALLVVTAWALRFTVFSPSTFHSPVISQHGIADERGFYYMNLGLRPTLARGTWFAHPWLIEGRDLRSTSGAYARCSIGMIAYAAGPDVRWIDPLALAEPFLSRLPSRDGARVGHYERALPPGYLDELINKSGSIQDAKLHALYADVDLATRAPLFDANRMGAIWRLNTGHHKRAAENFDRNLIALPGSPPSANPKAGCLGDRHAVTTKLEGNPIKSRQLPFLAPATTSSSPL